MSVRCADGVDGGTASTGGGVRRSAVATWEEAREGEALVRSVSTSSSPLEPVNEAAEEREVPVSEDMAGCGLPCPATFMAASQEARVEASWTPRAPFETRTGTGHGK